MIYSSTNAKLSVSRNHNVQIWGLSGPQRGTDIGANMKVVCRVLERSPGWEEWAGASYGQGQGMGQRNQGRSGRVVTELSSLSTLHPVLLPSFYNCHKTSQFLLHVMSSPCKVITMPWPIIRDFSDYPHSGDQSPERLLLAFSVTRLTDIITWKPCFKGKQVNCPSRWKVNIWGVFILKVTVRLKDSTNAKQKVSLRGTIN